MPSTTQHKSFKPWEHDICPRQGAMACWRENRYAVSGYKTINERCLGCRYQTTLLEMFGLTTAPPMK